MDPQTGTQSNIPDVNQLDSAEQDVNVPPAPEVEIGSLEQELGLAVAGLEPQEEEVQQLEQTTGESQQALLAAIAGLETQGERTLQAEEEAGIPELQTELTEITNEIRSTSLAFRRERERIQNTPGLSMADVNARLADVSRKQASQLADLEVIRAARSGSLANAQAITQRKLELQFADEQARINNLQFIYNENRELLTRKEDRLFQQQINLQQTKLDVAKDRAATLESLKLSLMANMHANGAPNGVYKSVQSAKTAADAFNAAGQYGVSIQDKMARAKYSQAFANAGAGDAAEQAAAIFGATTKMFNNKKGGKKAIGRSRKKRRFEKGKAAFPVRPGTAGADFRSDFENLQSLLTIDNLDLLSGVLSDTDIKLLQRASTSLNLEMSEERFYQTLSEVEETIAGGLGTTPQELRASAGIPEPGLGISVDSYLDNVDSYLSDSLQSSPYSGVFTF